MLTGPGDRQLPAERAGLPELPREPLCETFAVDETALQAGPSQQPVRYAPVREDIARAAEAIACARHPVIFAQRGARTAEGFARLDSLVREWAILWWNTGAPRLP